MTKVIAAPLENAVLWEYHVNRTYKDKTQVEVYMAISDIYMHHRHTDGGKRLPDKQ
jgi:hypothetical protein